MLKPASSTMFKLTKLNHVQAGQLNHVQACMETKQPKDCIA